MLQSPLAALKDVGLAATARGKAASRFRAPRALVCQSCRQSSLRSAAVITLTDNASAKVSDLIKAEDEDGLSLRVAVRPGGCSGFSYEMYFDTDVSDNDTTARYGDVQVVVDQSSAMLLEGATLDYSDSLQSAGFSIDNPNAQRTCGCGQSFS